MVTPERDARHTGKTLQRVRDLAWLLDNSIPIPGTSIRIGLDPILGLIPGLGDAVGALLSGYILLRAGDLGVSRGTLARMGLNVLIEALLGMVPLVGDLFDAGWKANQRNIKLLERSLTMPVLARRSDRLFLGVLVAGGGAVVLGLSYLTYLLLKWLL
jgi:hypothetical protein